MLYDKIMFDLDGTLIHSRPGIIAALRMMMRDMGLPQRDDEYMGNLVGPPFQLGFPKFLGLRGEDIERAITIYTGYGKTVFLQPGMLAPFPGVTEMLARLYARGLYMGVVTSKGATPTRDQLDRFGLSGYFRYVCTADDRGHGEKTALLQRTCAELGAAGLLMVGDRFYDLEAANACGVDSVGVLYGYGTAEEVARCRPAYTIPDIAALERLLREVTKPCDPKKEVSP